MSMTNDECMASLRVLLAVARADGQIHPREHDAIDVLAKTTFGVAAPAHDDELDVEAECARILSDKAKRLTLSAAMVIADIDEERSPEETALLTRIHKALGLSGEAEGPLLKAAHRARMGLLTMKLSEAQAEFFRELTQLSKSGSMDAKAYEKLLDQLDRKKIALLESAV